MPTLQVELQPFTVPNYVIQKMPPAPREHGVMEAPKYALNELSADTLDGLCNEFRREVFAKAGKPDRTAAPWPVKTMNAPLKTPLLEDLRSLMYPGYHPTLDERGVAIVQEAIEKIESLDRAISDAISQRDMARDGFRTQVARSGELVIELRAAEAYAGQTLALLRRVEWRGGSCAFCGAYSREMYQRAYNVPGSGEHSPDCELAAALRGHEIGIKRAVQVNGTNHQWSLPAISGTEVKILAACPADHGVWVEGPDGDMPVTDIASVPVSEGMRFFTGAKQTTQGADLGHAVVPKSGRRPLTNFLLEGHVLTLSAVLTEEQVEAWTRRDEALIDLCGTLEERAEELAAELRACHPQGIVQPVLRDDDPPNPDRAVRRYGIDYTD
jgi:hypothetical protein